jgi:hypothetical protein
MNTCAGRRCRYSALTAIATISETIAMKIAVSEVAQHAGAPS